MALLIFLRVSTGYGQPPSTLYDWTLSSSDSQDPNFKLSGEIQSRLEIEKFCDRITRALYTNRRDPVGLTSDQERTIMISFLTRDFDELEEQMNSQNDCKLKLCSQDLAIANKYQVSPTCICVPQISIFIYQPFSMIPLQRTTEGACCLYTSQQRHSSRPR